MSMTESGADGPEIVRGQLDPAYVRQRIEDWRKRIGTVYGQIEDWAKESGLAVRRGPPVVMNEEPMQRSGVDPVELPTMELSAGSEKLKLVPKGLWVIGANGRIDLFTTQGLFVLVDLAEPLAAPTWRIFGPARRDGVDLSAETVKGLLGMAPNA